MNEELQAIRDLASDFAGAELAAYTLEHEYPYGRPVSGLLRTAGDIGLFGVTLPVEWGGIGLDAAALAGLLQTISAVDAGPAAMILTHAAALDVIAAAAETEAARCRAIYERSADCGGAALAFQTYASPDEVDLPIVTGEDETWLSGTLSLVVLGGMARYAVVPAARPAGRSSYYLVDLMSAGITKSAPVLTVGLQAAQAVDIRCDNAPALRIGAEGQGDVHFRRMQSRMSMAAAAMSLGILEGSFAAAVAYTRQRYQGGRNIVDWSAVRMKLADMAVQIEVGRSVLRGIETASESARAALAAALHLSELACNGTVEGVQLLGGNGYMKEYGQEKRMRDARQARTLLGMAGLKKLNLIAKVLEETPL